MQAIKNQLSETYGQLSKIFKSLEVAAFEEGKDYGENLTGCFKWFLSPTAALYLQKRFPEDWKELENNSRFSCRPIPWQGHKGLGFDINLNL
jgi:hypothetical protein